MAWVAPADARIGMPPENGTTCVPWNSSEIVNLMNSQSAFLLRVDLNIGNAASPTGVPFVSLARFVRAKAALMRAAELPAGEVAALPVERGA